MQVVFDVIINLGIEKREWGNEFNRHFCLVERANFNYGEGVVGEEVKEWGGRNGKRGEGKKRRGEIMV